MYLATKDGELLPIPERKAAYYKSWAIRLKAWSRKSERAQLLERKKTGKRISYAGGRKPGE